MAFIVDRRGTINTFSINSPTTIKLDNGAVITETCALKHGAMFATRESAEAYSKFIKATDGNVVEAKKLHMQWLAKK